MIHHNADRDMNPPDLPALSLEQHIAVGSTLRTDEASA